MRERLLPYFPEADGFTTASVVARIAHSHLLVPEEDPDLFLAELRCAAGIEGRAVTRSVGAERDR